MVSLKPSLKSLFVLFVLMVAVFSTALNVAAVEKVVKFSRVSTETEARTFVIVNLEEQKKLTDSKVTVIIPELDLRARRNVDFSKSNKRSVHIELPVPAAYDPYVRIVFNSDQGKRIKHRPLIVQ